MNSLRQSWNAWKHAIHVFKVARSLRN